MKLSTLAFTLLISFFIYSISQAQIINPKRTAERKAEDRANRRIDQGIDKGLDKVEGLFKKKDKNNKESNSSDNNSGNQNNSNNNNNNNNNNNQSNPNTSGSRGNSQANELKAYANFDFVPGENLLFFDDFSNGFTHWDKIEWDINEEVQKGRITSSSDALALGSWFFMPRKGLTSPKNFKALPDQFTVEFDMMSDENHTEHEGGLNVMFIKQSAFDINNYSYYFDSKTRLILDVHPYGAWLTSKAFREYGYTKGFDNGERIFHETRQNYWKTNRVHRVSISKNGSHVKLYINQDLIIDLPNAMPANEKYIFCLGNNSWINGLYVSNVRIATGAPQPAKDLKEKKAYITRNIHFEVNSDKIKPSSYQILKEVAQAIKETEGNFKIVGHTDSDGDTNTNLELSKKRAAAVKSALSTEFGVDASRLETDGKGAAEPSEPNTTLQGKANNRRVEFIKL